MDPRRPSRQVSHIQFSKQPSALVGLVSPRGRVDIEKGFCAVLSFEDGPPVKILEDDILELGIDHVNKRLDVGQMVDRVDLLDDADEQGILSMQPRYQRPDGAHFPHSRHLNPPIGLSSFVQTKDSRHVLSRSSVQLLSNLAAW